MKKFDELSKKFSQNLKVLSITITKRKDVAINTLYDHGGWESIDHYFLDKSVEASKHIDLASAPFVYLFDKSKVLMAAGDPEELEIEPLVEKLIKGESILMKAEHKINEKIIPKKARAEILALASDPKFLKVSKGLELAWTKEETYDVNGTLIGSVYGKPELSLTYSVKYEEAAQEFQAKLFSFLSKGKESFKTPPQIEVTDTLKGVRQTMKNLIPLMEKHGMQEIAVVYHVERYYDYSQNFQAQKVTGLRQRHCPSMASYPKFDEFSSAKEALEQNDELLGGLSLRNAPRSFDRLQPFEVEDVMSKKSFTFAPKTDGATSSSDGGKATMTMSSNGR